MSSDAFTKVIEYLKKVPSIKSPIATGMEEGLWWIKFSIDLHHSLAWHVVQEFGHILNYLSTSEQLPTVFYPVSPPPYLNGGPEEYLSWVIENKIRTFSPNNALEWLQGRLPNPVDDISLWEKD